jgi:hypothetical protein
MENNFHIASVGITRNEYLQVEEGYDKEVKFHTVTAKSQKEAEEQIRQHYKDKSEEYSVWYTVDYINFFEHITPKQDYYQNKIVAFSKEIQKVMDIDDDELERLVDEDHAVEYGEYLLVFNARCFDNGWFNIIEVVPAELEKNHGYLNTNYLEDGERGWHYKLQGTRTEAYPPEEVRSEVLSLIKKEKV